MRSLRKFRGGDGLPPIRSGSSLLKTTSPNNLYERRSVDNVAPLAFRSPVAVQRRGRSTARASGGDVYFAPPH